MERTRIIRMRCLSTRDLVGKVRQFQALFEGDLPVVKLFGNFEDKKGDIAFLSSGHELSEEEVYELSHVRGTYFKAKIDDETCHLKPMLSYAGEYPKYELWRETT